MKENNKESAIKNCKCGKELEKFETDDLCYSCLKLDCKILKEKYGLDRII